MGCFVTLSIFVLVCVLSRIAKGGVCQVLRNQELMYQNFNIYMLTNYDQNIQSRFRLLKVCVCVKLESRNCRKLIFNFCKAQSTENQSRSIETHADYFSTEFSNSIQAHMTCRFLCFVLSIKEKTLATFQKLLICYVCESLVRSRGVYLHIHLGLSRSSLMLKAW